MSPRRIAFSGSSFVSATRARRVAHGEAAVDWNSNPAEEVGARAAALPAPEASS